MVSWDLDANHQAYHRQCEQHGQPEADRREIPGKTLEERKQNLTDVRVGEILVGGGGGGSGSGTLATSWRGGRSDDEGSDPKSFISCSNLSNSLRRFAIFPLLLHSLPTPFSSSSPPFSPRDEYSPRSCSLATWLKSSSSRTAGDGEGARQSARLSLRILRPWLLLSWILDSFRWLFSLAVAIIPRKHWLWDTYGLWLFKHWLTNPSNQTLQSFIPPILTNGWDKKY